MSDPKSNFDDKNNKSVIDNNTSGPTGIDSEIIDKLYDVAVDPKRLEQLVIAWENQIAPHRSQAEFHKFMPNFDQATMDHFTRVSLFLDRLPKAAEQEKTTNPIGSVLTNDTSSLARCIIDKTFSILERNVAGNATFKIGSDISESDIHLNADDFSVLKHEILRSFDGHAAVNKFLRFRSDTDDRIVVFQIDIVSIATKNVALITTSELGWSSEFEHALEAAFELSSAEILIVKSLVEGRTLKSIAQKRKRSIETVRTQVRAIQSKTGTRSQSELIRITLAIMGMLPIDTEVQQNYSKKDQSTLDKITPHTINRPNDRKLDYITFGDIHGKPCFYLPLSYGFIRWPAAAENVAKAMNMKIIVPIRAGYGRSTELEENADLIKEYTDDFIAILDHQNVKTCPILSIGSDSFFAFQLASRFPHKFNAIVSCGGWLPHWKRAQYERMQKWHRFIMANARYSPKILPYLVKFSFHLSKSMGQKSFLDAVFSSSKADLQTYNKPDIFEALVTGSQVTLSETHSAHKAFAKEVILQAQLDWRADVESVASRIPVHFLNGLQDQAVPEQTLNEYQEEYKFIEYNIYPKAGKLLFFQEWQLVLKLLRQYL